MIKNARQNMARQQPNNSLAEKTAVLNSLAEVRRYHALGIDSLAQVSDGAYGMMADEARRLSLPQEYLRKARQFASQYDAAALNDLCRQCQDGGYAIGWSRVILLLSVAPRHRRAVVRDAVASRWTRQQLAAEIRRRFGRRAKSGAGRPTKLGSDATPDAAYVKGAELCAKFGSFMTAMRRPEGEREPLLATLPPSTRACLLRAEKMMGALQRALTEKVTPRSREAK